MKLDEYDYVGVIAPGMIIVAVSGVYFPDALPSLGTDLTVGDLGIALILAFVAGHDPAP